MYEYRGSHGFRQSDTLIISEEKPRHPLGGAKIVAELKLPRPALALHLLSFEQRSSEGGPGKCVKTI